MTTLTERIKNGSGEDRKLDDAIALHFGWAPKQTFDGEWYWADPAGNGCGENPPAFTRDLNVVFALVARELPDWVADCDATAPDADILWRLTAPEDATTHGFKGECFAKNAFDISAHCRAILLALLAAKEQRT